MNELDALRQEAETLKNAIRVSLLILFIYPIIIVLLCHSAGMTHTFIKLEHS